MKKLLSILAVTTLTVTSTTLLVSCTKEVKKHDKLQYDLKILKEILFGITGKDVDINFNFGDYLTESEVNGIIQSTLDSALGLQSSFDTTNSNLEKLSKDFKKYEKIEEFDKSNYASQSKSIAQRKLFKEYTTALSNNQSFDFQKSIDGFALNPIKDGTVPNFDSTQDDISFSKGDVIKFGDTIWATNVEGKNSEENKIGIPTIEMFTKEFSDGKPNFAINDKPISAQNALSLRFQDYFENQLESEIISDVLVMSHMTSSLFKYRDGDAYIDPNNQFTNKLQDFGTTQGADWNTSVRMIWTIKYKKLDAGQNVELGKKLEEVNKEFGKKATFVDAIKEIKGFIPPENLIEKDTSYDSYFGLSGYQGIKFNGFGDDPASGKKWEKGVNETKNGPAIIYNSPSIPGFEVENPNYSEIAIVLPIYFIELLAGSTSKNDDAAVKEDKEDKTSIYSIHDSGENKKAVKLGRAGLGDKEDILSKWKELVDTKGSHDVRNILAKDDNRNNLINELMYMACTGVNFVESAKRDIYSKYLDKDKIYYSGIWDLVSPYIVDNKDEDM